jgi:hypothetical protein
MTEILAIDSECFWTANPSDEALAIAKSGFGKHFLISRRKQLEYGHYVIELFVDDCAVEPLESAVESELDAIGWQMVVLDVVDKTRFRDFPKREKLSPTIEFVHPLPPRNRYAIAPILAIEPRPAVGFHATETVNLNGIRLEGLKPSSGAHRYPNTKGKIYACPRLGGDFESAERWAIELSKAKQLSPSAFSILELKLTAVPEARIYRDLHSASGIVLDRLASVPPTAITVLTVNSSLPIPQAPRRRGKRREK